MASVPSSWTPGARGLCERLLCGIRVVPDKEDVEMLTQPHRQSVGQTKRREERGWRAQVAEKKLE